jgi:hypothetical protein
MSKTPRKRGNNVVSMRPRTPDDSSPSCDVRDNTAAGATALAAPGSAHDPVMAEALRLIEAFLAIEDATARAALIALAERLVSYDWLRNVQQR